MKRFEALFAALVLLIVGLGGNCSRARVESMNHMNSGVIHALTKRYPEAVEELERATAIDGTNDQAFYNLALVHVEMGLFDRAKDDLQRAISLNADIANYHEKLGTVLMELEDWQGAKTALESAIERDENLFKAYYKLAQVYEQLDDNQNALRQYTAAIEHGPRFLLAYSQLGRLYANLHYLDQAVQVLQGASQVAVAGTTEEASVHHLLGTVYQQQRNFDGAVEEFSSALEIDPSNADALFSLGWTYSLQNDREEARRFLKKYVDVAGADAPAHYMKAAQDRLAEFGQGP